jgi:hypothetical protein
MHPGYVSHRVKAEDFVEVDEEEARTSFRYSTDEVWPALQKREGRRPADQERLLLILICLLINRRLLLI